MIIYLTVVALANLALGYLLASYLGPLGKKRHAAETVVETHGEQAHDESSHGEATAQEPIATLPEPPVVEAAPIPIQAAAPPVAPAAVAAPPAPEVAREAAPIAAAPVVAESTPDTSVVAETVEVEQSLLSGIDEFRNQLAQMQSVAAAEEDAAIDELAAAPA